MDLGVRRCHQNKHMEVIISRYWSRRWELSIQNGSDRISPIGSTMGKATMTRLTFSCYAVIPGMVVAGPGG